ncbi:methyltransferase domain-containing protein [Bacillus sp. SB49]|uniref:class I SAM-dependent methyltransferase n=1 Tax=Bacillaceae TaxID=186817 RepID=UPI0002A5195C|nr:MULTISPECIES: class I SAM-dependent methyltransferase [Bacillaceae]ELK47473.1 methyltransferase [Halobacillus sp. BAB-2008]QHT45265.1 methyltransferase domain-containing protein [Bacillus sp. SB49]
MTEDRKDRVKRNFTRSRESYVQSKTHNNAGDLQELIHQLSPLRSWKVLDIATGGGHVARTLSPYVQTVYATDLTKAMLENTASHLQHLENIEYIVADAEQLPFLDESFDAVTCRIAAHHFPEPLSYIKECYRVLKPGGTFLMIDNTAPDKEELDRFYNTFEQWRDDSHVRAWKISEWKQWLLHEGFLIKKESLKQKNLPFRDWVERTCSDRSIQNQVEAYMMTAPASTKQYFSIQTSEGHVDSFSIDEWMVVGAKSS